MQEGQGHQGKCRSIDDKGGKNGKKKKTWGKFPFWEKKKKTHPLLHFESTSESINSAEELRTATTVNSLFHKLFPHLQQTSHLLSAFLSSPHK